ncbi:MAG: histidine kinase dimerization/phospho-acceptor domain-containing protein, partial [Rhodothermales bacterium]
MNEDEPGRKRPDAEPKARGEQGEPPRAPAYLSGADATLRHTLRTPLNHIIGYSELLLEEAKERGLEDMVADLRNIHAAGKELLALINELFNPAPVDTDSSAPVLDTVALSATKEPSDAASGTQDASADETPHAHLLVV